MSGKMGWLRRQRDRLLRRGTRVAAAHPVSASSSVDVPQLRRPVRLPDKALSFAPNPGELMMYSHVPHGLSTGAPLVVLLHGCGQNPEDFATQSGWRLLAAKHHFALLMPGQTEENNPQTCFNWFRRDDIRRDHGEVASVVAMIKAALHATHCDPKRVYVTGLSAGGALTAALLAAYPEMFAAGAVVAGLPAHSASNVVSAMSRMAGRGGEHDPQEWADLARKLGDPHYAGRWPRVSVWQGLADTMVKPRNGQDVAVQFAALHGVEQNSSVVGQRMVWGDPDHPAVELWQLPEVGHVYPTEAGEGISAAHVIAKFWGLL